MPMEKFDFANLFEDKIKLLYPDGIEWGIVGILTKNGNVYTLSYDSKILSGIFEIFCEPIVRSIAKDHEIVVETSAQNVYPDFTLFRKNEPSNKIAIEVKSIIDSIIKTAS